ncbi:MAG: hypothetical protein Q8P97_01315 [bacterium]|nr:hypothetical protein [bacterium]
MTEKVKPERADCLKIILDTNSYDYAALDGGYLLSIAAASGKIELWSTQVETDQIKNIKDLNAAKAQKRDVMLAIIGSTGTTSTHGYFPGLSRPGWADSIDPLYMQQFLGTRIPNDRNKYDALIASTASVKADVFVTNDKSLKNLFNSAGKKINKKSVAMDNLEFYAFLKNITS